MKVSVLENLLQFWSVYQQKILLNIKFYRQENKFAKYLQFKPAIGNSKYAFERNNKTFIFSRVFHCQMWPILDLRLNNES